MNVPIIQLLVRLLVERCTNEGYLSLKDYDASKAAYTLSFPNKEVEYGFLDSLLPAYAGNVGVNFDSETRQLQDWKAETWGKT